MSNGRCRYHGGKSTGAKNPRVKHGRYSKAVIEGRLLLNQLLNEAKGYASEISKQSAYVGLLKVTL